MGRIALKAGIWALPPSWLVLSRIAHACPYTIREVGFAPLKREPYRVCLLVGRDARSKKAISVFESVARKVLKDSNVVAEVVDVSVMGSHRALAGLPPSALRVLPRAVLLAPWGATLPLPKVDYASREAVRDQLEAVVSSPLRERIKRAVVEDWCVVLLVEGRSPQGNRRAQREIERAIEGVRGEVTEMGAVIERGPRLLKVSPREAKRERILLWSLGLLGGGRAKAVVLFGRGQQIGPVLEGGRIGRAALESLFRLLGRNCSCTTDIKWLSGRRIPLRWDEKDRERVCQELGFDPESPRVLATLASVGVNVDRPDACKVVVMAYTEGALEVEDAGGQPPSVSLYSPPRGKEPEPPSMPAGGEAELDDEAPQEEGLSEKALLGYREYIAGRAGYREVGEREEPRRKGPPKVALSVPPSPRPSVGGKVVARAEFPSGTGKERVAPKLAKSPAGIPRGVTLPPPKGSIQRRAGRALLLVLVALLASAGGGALLIWLGRRGGSA